MSHQCGESWVGWMGTELCVALIMQDKQAKGKQTLEAGEVLADKCHPRGITGLQGPWTSGPGHTCS